MKAVVKKLSTGFIVCAMAIFMACTLVYGADPTAQNPRVLSFSMMNPPSHFLLNNKGAIIKWIEAVEKETGGRIKFKIYNAESLGKAKDQVNLILKGVADCAGFVPAFTPGYFPLTTIVELPFAAPGKTSAVQAKAMWDLYQQGLLDKKWKELKVLSIDLAPGDQIFTNKKIVKLEDFQGVKLACASPVWIRLAKTLGATPVHLSTTDSYLGLQRGMIDARVISWASAPSYKLDEVVKYVLESDWAASAVGIAMNLKTWNSLPRDIQKIIDGVNERFVGYVAYGAPDRSVMGFEMYGIEVSRPLFIKKGVEVYQLSPQEEARLQKTLTPLWDHWVKDMEAKGLDSKKVMKAYLAALKKHGGKPLYAPEW